MQKVGFIGYGHMGSVLLNSLLQTSAIIPSQVVLYTRTISKAKRVKIKYPDITLGTSNIEVVKKCDVIFICTGTYEVQAVLHEIAEELSENSHIIIFSGGLEIKAVETLFHGPITKIIPTLLSEINEGVTLACHNNRVSNEKRNNINKLLEHIGKVMEIPEEHFEIGAEFTSCSPGLISAISELFIKEAIKKSNFKYEDAKQLFISSMLGTAKLLQEKNEGFSELINRVATSGGATEGGVEVINEEMPQVFDHMYEAIKQRHENRKARTREQFQI